MGEYVMGFIWAHFVRSEEPSVRSTRVNYFGVLARSYRWLSPPGTSLDMVMCWLDIWNSLRNVTISVLPYNF